MGFPRLKKMLQHSPKMRRARPYITRGAGTGWFSPMTRAWSCLLSVARPGFIPRGYAGPQATNSQRIEKLLDEMHDKTGPDRVAYFVCAIALAERGRAMAIVTDRADGEILQAPRGSGGFGYDPVFYFPALKKTFAELPAEEKNQRSHRGKAFRRLLAALSSML